MQGQVSVAGAVNKAAATKEYKGKTYYFCSKSCSARFEEDPEKFLKEE